MTELAVLGIILAAMAVMMNDSIQTLGTFLNSNRNVKWYWLWVAASTILVGAVLYGWYQGDISYGRLDKFPPVEITWYHVAAPATLLLLTLGGIPVSTTFLVLTIFASSVVMEKMLIKSFVGYSLAAIAGYVVWLVITKLGGERKIDCPKTTQRWRVAQWFTTGFLWWTWLSHDLANIAIFAPRDMGVGCLLLVLGICVSALGIIFYLHGGKIQDIVTSKTDTNYVKNATLVDLFYAFLLFYFKEMNSIPMSTTWVFVGLLCGRELAISACTGRPIKEVWPIVGSDFLKIMFGLGVSIALVWLVKGF